MTDRLHEMACIFLQAGRVVQASQQMESCIKLSLTIFDVTENTLNSDEDFEEIYGPFSKVTLGNLARKIRNKIDFLPEDVDVLESAIRERNYVIHSFFHENGTHFLTSEGRNTAYMKLMKAQTIIDSGYKILDSIVQNCLNKYGLDIQKITRSSGEIFDKS